MSESLKELQHRVDAYAQTLEVNPRLSTQEVTVHDRVLLPSLEWPGCTTSTNLVDEFLIACWELEAVDFIREAYRVVLDREADKTGLAHYQRELDCGHSRLEVVLSLLASHEAKSRHVSSELLGVWPRCWRGLRFLNKLGLRFINQLFFNVVQHRVIQRVSRYSSPPFLSLLIKNTINAWRRPLERLGANQRAQTFEVRALQQELAQLQGAHREVLAQLQGLKLLSTPVKSVNDQVASQSSASDARLEAYYLAFEEANRGSEEAIAKKLQVYQSWATQQQKLSAYPVLDLGCGRGEWLQWLNHQGLIAHGVDSNPLMVARCQEQKLSVTHSDLLTHLNVQTDQTLGAVSAFQVIEHLPFDVLFDLVGMAWQKLVSGGSILLETPNPENLLVATHTFYHDFTHRHPVTPTALSFLLRYHGFVELEIVRSHPYPPSARVPGHDPLTERVNGHLCGPQDYAVIAYKP